MPVELPHEICAWSDTIVLELFVILTPAIIFKPADQIFIVFSTSESPASLVVHLGSWGHTVKTQKQQLFGLNQVNNIADVIEDVEPDLFDLSGHDLCLEYD